MISFACWRCVKNEVEAPGQMCDRCAGNVGRIQRRAVGRDFMAGDDGSLEWLDAYEKRSNDRHERHNVPLTRRHLD